MTTGQLHAEDGEPVNLPSLEHNLDIWHYVAALRRRWWLILSTVVVAFTATWWAQGGKLPAYTAEALLQQVSDPTSSTPWGLALRPDLGTHIDIMRSSEVLTPVVDSLGLQLRMRNYQDQRSRLIGSFSADRGARQIAYELERHGDSLRIVMKRGGRVVAAGPAGKPLEGPDFALKVADYELIDEPVEFGVANFDVALEALDRKLRIEEGSGTSLIWIRMTDPDPELASRAVNAVARSYQRYRANSARETAGRRREFIARQLAAVADTLRSAQQNVINYQASTLYDPNTEGSAVVAELLQVDQSMRELRYQESLLSGLVAGLQTSGENDTALQQVMALGSDLVPQGPELSRRLQDLQLRRAELTASRFGLTSQDPQVQVVDSLIVETKAQAALAADQALRLLRDRISQEQSRYNQLRGRAGSLPLRTAEYGRLQQRVEAVQGVFDQLVDTYFEAQIAEGVEVGDIDLVAPADVPVWPDASYRTLALAAGGIVGFLLGVVGALLLDQLDSRVRKPFDAERATHLEVVGTIPSIKSIAEGSRSAQLSKDAFRTLRTHLRFASSRTQPRVIAVTSATPREGKSTVAANLAMTLADQGRRTLLVDADLRRPQVHSTFGISQEPGLAEVLLDGAAVHQAARLLPAHGYLSVLTCGRGVENPAELIGDPEFERLIQQLRGAYDYVVVDTPPLLAVTDASLVGALADGTLIVVRANKTDTDALEIAVRQLRRLRVPLLGIVLNGVPTGRSSGYSYYPSDYPPYAAPGADAEPNDQRRRPLLRSGRGEKAG